MTQFVLIKVPSLKAAKTSKQMTKCKEKPRLLCIREMLSLGSGLTSSSTGSMWVWDEDTFLRYTHPLSSAMLCQHVSPWRAAEKQSARHRGHAAPAASQGAGSLSFTQFHTWRHPVRPNWCTLTEAQQTLLSTSSWAGRKKGKPTHCILRLREAPWNASKKSLYVTRFES